DGYDIVQSDEEADVYIINSCTVTSVGDKKTRQTMRKFKRQNPAAKIALTGCFPQAFPDISKELPEADIITGSYNRAGLIKSVKEAFATGNTVVDITPHKPQEKFEQMQSQGFAQHTRAFIKIEDGCDRYCTYCIIPKARGPVRSKELEDLKTEVMALAESGYKEVVLVGINLSSYGKEIGARLVDAVELACSIDGIERVRLGSLEPELLTDEDMDRLVNLQKFCPQFHLSLQSGEDETLKRMKRHYNTASYRQIVCKIRDKFKNPSITTDIMVGFPGESQVEFEKSLAFAKEIAFAKVHVFA
ncbi:MAG: MiaB/RimO family radical SAM methylthiotransferase, partial [Oscillospiraceae bacterium]